MPMAACLELPTEFFGDRDIEFCSGRERRLCGVWCTKHDGLPTLILRLDLVFGVRKPEHSVFSAFRVAMRLRRESLWHHPSAGPVRSGGIRVDKPSARLTGRVMIWTFADFKPGRLPLMVMVPDDKVERTPTRLMPHSVFRYRLFVESTLPLL